MKFSAHRGVLLKPIQAVMGVVERRQTMPILANLLLVARDKKLSMTATDLEVELVASTENARIDEEGEITVPGRKLLDICRALPEDAEIKLNSDGERIVLRSGRSRFSLATLSANDFPTVEDIAPQQALTVEQSELKRLLDKTHFSMAQNDVRYYLNGMLLEVDGQQLRAVATDGHRLALCSIQLPEKASNQQVIVPRKGVLELQRLLGDQGTVEISIGTNHIRVAIDSIRFTSKLVDGRFPDYAQVIPSDYAEPVTADRQTLRQALNRAAILSNEKYRGIRLELDGEKMTIHAHNPEHEEAEETIEVQYGGATLEIGFNVNYLLDALLAVESDDVEVGLGDANSSCLIREPGLDTCKYVVMPMRL